MFIFQSTQRAKKRQTGRSSDQDRHVVGRFALNELVIHGWDVARATGQPFDCDTQALEACWELLAERATAGQEPGDDDPFGPVVDVPADAPLLDRLIGLSGRKPSWTAV
jgi:uncharacterized protein (TIGR03086 family)